MISLQMTKKRIVLNIMKDIGIVTGRKFINDNMCEELAVIKSYYHSFDTHDFRRECILSFMDGILTSVKEDTILYRLSHIYLIDKDMIYRKASTIGFNVDAVEENYSG